MNPMSAEQIAEADRRFAAGELVFVWCLHHDILCEPLIEPLSSRVRYIETEKPEHERARRLEELQIVRHQERLPQEWVAKARAWWEAHRAWQEVNRTWWATYRTRQATQRTWQETYRAWHEADHARLTADLALRDANCACAPALEALHREECPSSAWDGSNIFGGQR